jgi:bacteriorhodopsin
MSSDVLHAVQEEPASSVRLGTIVAVAILDITGVLAAVGAAAVLTLNDSTDRRWWWWAVGLQSLLAVVTTVLLTRWSLGATPYGLLASSRAPRGAGAG